MAIGFPSGTASLTLTDLNNGFTTTGTPSYVNVMGLDISPTGDRVFLASRDTDSIYRYDLSTPFDFTTASHVQTLSLGGINPAGIKFNPTGNRLFVLNTNGPVLQWIGTGPYSLSTAGAWQSYNYDNAIPTGNTRGIAFNTNGTKMTVLGYGGTSGIWEFDLTTGFDPSTATYNNVYFNTAPYMTVPMNHWFNSTGTKLYISNYSGSKIHTFYLATPFDISSSNVTVGPISNNAPGGGEQHQHIFNADETQLYVIKSGTGSSGTIISMSFVETSGVQDGDEFTFNNRDYIYDGTKGAWEVNSPITVAQSGSPVSDLSELADSTSILSDPANEVLTYADLDAILAVTSPATGQLAFNLDTLDMYIFGGTNWQKVYDEDDVPAAPTFIWGGDRGVFGGGTNTMDYIDITSPGNATDFGDLIGTKANPGAASNSTRGVFFGGNGTLDINYITVSTPSNALDFGDLTQARSNLASLSDGTYGLTGGGITSNTGQTTIDYVVMDTTSNALDFADLTQGRWSLATGNSDTYGLFAGGSADFSTKSNTIDYVTIATTSNALDFGDLTVARDQLTGTSDANYSIFAGGYDGNSTLHNTIDYVTTATPSNASDFGDMTTALYQPSACSNGTYGVIGGGVDSYPATVNIIQYFTIATPSNASDFGDLTQLRGGLAALSGSPS